MSSSFRRLMAAGFLISAVLTQAGCFVGDENHWASRAQVADAATRCGLRDFKPTKAGDAWAAYVDSGVPGRAAKEDCIYADLNRQGLLATR